MSTIGNFTVGTARRLRPGGVVETGNTVSSATEIWGCLQPKGTTATFANCDGLPAVDSVHPTIANLVVSSYTFTDLSKTGENWEITVAYTPGVAEDPEEPDEDDDFALIVSREVGDFSYTKDLLIDANTGAPIINAAGEPFASTISVEVCSPMIKLVQLEANNTINKLKLSGTINSSSFSIFGLTIPKHCGRVKVSAVDLNNGLKSHFQVEYIIEIRHNNVMIGGVLKDIGWDEAILEQGYNYREAAGSSKLLLFQVPVEGNSSQMVNAPTPQLLKLDGTSGQGGPGEVKVVSCFVENSWNTLNINGTTF